MQEKTVQTIRLVLAALAVAAVVASLVLLAHRPVSQGPVQTPVGGDPVEVEIMDAEVPTDLDVRSALGVEADFPGIEADEPERTWRMLGVVEDESGSPISGAEVTLDSLVNEPRVTDEAGRFMFESPEFNLFARLRAVLATHPEFAPSTTEVRLPAGFAHSREFDIRIQMSRGVSVEVTVIDEAGVPVRDAHVRLRRVVDASITSPANWVLSSAEWERALRRSCMRSPGTTGGSTDKAGVARIVAKPGRFALTAWKPGFLHRRDDETLREVGRNGQSFSYRLERGSSVRGRIHEFDDQPVSGATVFASVSSLSNGFCWGISTSAEDGSFEISGLPTDARRAMLIARHPDFAPTMERPDNPAEFQVMTMGKGRGLICTLFDAATGEELPDGLPVKLDFESPESGSGIWLGRAMPTAAAEVRGGSFLVEGIPDFVGSVRLSCAGYAPGRVDLSGEREDTILRTLQLAHLRRHVVIVIDGSTGERVDGAEVTLWTGERGADGAINRTSTWNLPASVAPEGIEFHIADHYLPAEGECSIQVSGPRHSTVRHLFQRTDLEARAPWVVRLDRHD